MEAAAAALTVRSTSGCLAAASAPAHGHRRAAAALLRRNRRTPCGRLRALPPEISEILSPKLVPGSPSDTGDVSSLIPVRRVPLDYAVMLLFYLVSNWVVPELVMKRLQPNAEEEAAATSMSSSTKPGDAADGDDLRKTRTKVKKKKSRKETIIKV
ncbi:hypothetical protein EJB05_34169, partial [Eragrostis curvula]